MVGGVVLIPGARRYCFSKFRPFGGGGPVEDPRTRGDSPDSGAALDPIDVAAAAYVEPAVAATEDCVEVNLGVGDISFDVERVVGDEVRVGAPLGLVHGVRPGDELGGR